MDILFGIAFVVSFTGLMLAFISAKKVQTRLTALRAENERLQEALSLLVESVEVGGWPSAAIVIAKAALAAKEE